MEKLYSFVTAKPDITPTNRTLPNIAGYVHAKHQD